MLHGIGEATCLPCPNLALMSAATCSHASAFRLEMMTCAPCSASRSAIAFPMPFVDPVIKAVLPDRSNKLIFPPDRVSGACLILSRRARSYKGRAIYSAGLAAGAVLGERE